MIEYNYNTRILTKKSTEKFGPFLSAHELKCHCTLTECSITIVSNNLIKCFNNLRDLVQRPLQISSAYRCPYYNDFVGGSLLSRHQVGEALDIIKPDSIDLLSFEQLALKAGFTYAKRYTNPERLHVDTR
jgi:uncharacterized protein YcbK (DUF882 family)